MLWRRRLVGLTTDEETYALPCFSASPARSTPGPLPCHIAYMASTVRSGLASARCLPNMAVPPSSLRRQETLAACVEQFLRLPQLLVDHVKRRPAAHRTRLSAFHQFSTDFEKRFKSRFGETRTNSLASR